MAQQQGGDLRHARTGIELRPGLDGVPATKSAICDIDGDQGLLTYRGYPMEDLAVNSSFLETAYLLIWGELPTDDQLQAFEHEVQMHRRVSFRVRDMMKCFPASAEHSLNASTFSARVTASTLTDPYAVIASAVGTLAGPLHGGANEDVLAMLEEVGSPAQAGAFLDEAIAAKRKIMGFGHREYKVKDPRAVILQSLVEEMFNDFGHDDLYDVARAIEHEAMARLGPKGIYPNVDFYSGLVYRKLGIPRDLFTPVFAIARVAGWLAHWREQLGANRIFRPSQIYSGAQPRRWTPMEKRAVSTAD